MQLLLARHGNTFEKNEIPRYVGAVTDLPLTDYGREQADKIAKYIAAQKINLKNIYFGPLKRQSESAAIIHSSFPMTSTLSLVSELSEINYGPWEGLTRQEIQNKWPMEFSAWTEKGVWPNTVFPETENQFRSRLSSWLQSLSHENVESQAALAVTSNGTLRYIYALVCGEVTLKTPSISKVGTGRLCEINLVSGTFTMVKWNVSCE